MKPTIIAVTGHPATGKTTFAHYLAEEMGLPLIWKDQIKESLLETLGVFDTKWSRKLSVATWALLYQQIENLLKANISHIVESNFDPAYANSHWSRLFQKYEFRLIQIRCETEPEALLKRYRQRISDGSRLIGHVDVSEDLEFLESIKHHMGWIDGESIQLSLNTTDIEQLDYSKIARKIKMLIN
ncbi:MAG: hypothetical protein DWQ04_01440 [Chloroflexi bacterium]|nr:MAG: hypothetical protein DWQ04_01440 [Chloroflexota bacterium]